MKSDVFTIRDLEQLELQACRRRRRDSVRLTREYVITFVFLAVCWLVRELFAR